MSEAKDKDVFSEYNMLEDLKDFDQYNIVDDTDELLNLINNQNNSSSHIEESFDSINESDNSNLQSIDILDSLDFLLDGMKDDTSNQSILEMEDGLDQLSNEQQGMFSNNQVEEDRNDVLGIKANSDNSSELLNQEAGSDYMDNTNEKNELNEQDELFDILDKMLMSEEESQENDNEQLLKSLQDENNEDFDSGSVNSSIDNQSVNSDFDEFDFESLGIEHLVSDSEQEYNNDDILSINNLFDDEDEYDKSSKNSNNMSNIFSDVLGAVSTLEDPYEDELASLIPDISEVKKAKKKNILNEINQNKENQNIESPKKNKPKKNQTDKKQTDKKQNFLSKLFDNVKDQTEEEYVNKVKIEKEKEEKKAEEKKVLEAKEKEEKARKTSENKEAKKKAQTEKAADKKELKEKKAKEKAEKVAAAAKEAEFLYEGRINKVGASVVMVFFAAIAVIVIVGTNTFSYNLSIKHATEFLSRQKYNKAYEELAGMKIKDKDQEIYNKVKTIMSVNRELNSYNNYFAMKYYPEALDALLKGLSKYDKYITQGDELGVKKDLDSIKSNLVTALNDEFNLTEQHAKEIIELEDRNLYGKKVYEIATLKMKTKEVSFNN